MCFRGCDEGVADQSLFKDVVDELLVKELYHHSSPNVWFDHDVELLQSNFRSMGEGHGSNLANSKVGVICPSGVSVAAPSLASVALVSSPAMVIQPKGWDVQVVVSGLVEEPIQNSPVLSKEIDYGGASVGVDVEVQASISCVSSPFVSSASKPSLITRTKSGGNSTVKFSSWDKLPKGVKDHSISKYSEYVSLDPDREWVLAALDLPKDASDVNVFKRMFELQRLGKIDMSRKVIRIMEGINEERRLCVS